MIMIIAGGARDTSWGVCLSTLNTRYCTAVAGGNSSTLTTLVSGHSALTKALTGRAGWRQLAYSVAVGDCHLHPLEHNQSLISLICSRNFARLARTNGPPVDDVSALCVVSLPAVKTPSLTTAESLSVVTTPLKLPVLAIFVIRVTQSPSHVTPYCPISYITSPAASGPARPVAWQVPAAKPHETLAMDMP